MAESNSDDRHVPHNIPWTIQQIHENSHHFASSATQRIHDLHHYVIQGLTPLINTSSVRSVHEAYNRNLRDRNSMEFMNDQNLPSTFNTSEIGSQDFVIEIDNQSPDTLAHTISSQNANNGPASDLAAEQHRATEAVDVANIRNLPEFQMLVSFAEKYVPFILILLIKLAFDHRIGILVVIGLFVTFFHANVVVKNEISKQAKRSLMKLLWVCLNLILCITIIYSLLAEKGLGYALIFVPPYDSPISIWEVLWVILVTDFVLRMITILLKVFVVAIPPSIMACQKKGKHYVFIERTSQLYRTIAPMQHWLYFFSESYTGPSKVFGVILSASYLILKCKSILHKAKSWKKTLIKVFQNKTYGKTPTLKQIKEAGDSCPICQDDYKSPSMLKCKHIFCEECVAIWFDKERTCPICRAQIADNPSWRDGSTSLALQIF